MWLCSGGPLVGDNLPLSGNLRTPMNIPAFYLSYARGVVREGADTLALVLSRACV